MSACDVRVHDETPASYPANGIGLYSIAASIERPLLVAPDSAFVGALIDGELLHLTPDASGTHWHGLFSVRCRRSFNLQFRAIWSIQNITTRTKRVPEHPRTVELIEPEPPRQVLIDTSAESRTGWSGVAHYQFITAPMTTVRALRIEPLSAARGDVRSAAALRVITPTPLMAGCGSPVDVSLHSAERRAGGYLVLETDNPGLPHWRTEIRFSP